MQQRPRINKKLVASFIAVLVLIVGIVMLGNYLNSQPVQVDFENVTKVDVYDAQPDQDNPSPVATITSSGSSVRLQKDTRHFFAYEGAEGYASGTTEFTPTGQENATVTISPYFSDAKLDALLDDELDAIRQTLRTKYGSPVNDYELQRGKLYKFGEWYGTTLKYVGDDIFNSDTLRVVLGKDDAGTWSVATDPPSISLSKFLFPDVPVEILRDVNKLK